MATVYKILGLNAIIFVRNFEIVNVLRYLGDHCYKCNTDLPPEEQMISAFPDIQTAELTKENDIMVIACDGIW